MADLTDLSNAIDTALQSSVDMATGLVNVCRACADFMPGDGCAVTLMASDESRETVYASDEVITDVERLQYSLGEGPSGLAFATGRPVLVPDTTSPTAGRRWPVLMGELAQLPVQAVFAFPMRFGVVSVAVCALYRRQPGSLSQQELGIVLDAIDLTTLALLELREGAGQNGLGGWIQVDGHNRRQVHQATGMLIVQLGVSAEVAFSRLRAHAFLLGIGIEEVADDIVNRRLRLEPDSN